MKKEKIPNPGSKEAMELGCRCPVLDNNYGKGSNFGPNTFYINETCPLHSSKNLKSKPVEEKSTALTPTDFKGKTIKEIVNYLNSQKIIQTDYIDSSTLSAGWEFGVVGHNSDYDDENKDYMTTLYICEIFDDIKIGVIAICCIFDDTTVFEDYEFELQFVELKEIVTYGIKE